MAPNKMDPCNAFLNSNLIRNWAHAIRREAHVLVSVILKFSIRIGEFKKCA